MAFYYIVLTFYVYLFLLWLALWVTKYTERTLCRQAKQKADVLMKIENTSVSDSDISLQNSRSTVWTFHQDSVMPSCVENGIAGTSTVWNFDVLESEQNTSDIEGQDTEVAVNDSICVFNKGSNIQCWPILGLLEEDKNKNLFVIGLFVGKSKPNDVNSYLKHFVEEIKIIESEGITFAGKPIKLNILNFVCDSPARAFVKNVKYHNGYHGCEKCIQSGV